MFMTNIPSFPTHLWNKTKMWTATHNRGGNPEKKDAMVQDEGQLDTVHFLETAAHRVETATISTKEDAVQAGWKWPEGSASIVKCCPKSTSIKCCVLAPRSPSFRSKWGTKREQIKCFFSTLTPLFNVLNLCNMQVIFYCLGFGELLQKNECHCKLIVYRL